MTFIGHGLRMRATQVKKNAVPPIVRRNKMAGSPD
jgi:hypothetical protein